jgi:hypothetical protein
LQERFSICHKRGISIIAAGVYSSGILADRRANAKFNYADAEQGRLAETANNAFSAATVSCGVRRLISQRREKAMRLIIEANRQYQSLAIAHQSRSAIAMANSLTEMFQIFAKRRFPVRRFYMSNPKNFP